LMGAISTDLPPARFDHPNPAAIVEVMSFAEIQQLCAGSVAAKDMPARGAYLGCSFRSGPVCFVYIASIPEMETTRRHEIGHCNGWSPRHER